MSAGVKSIQVTPRTFSSVQDSASAEASCQDWIAEEVAVALVYNGISHAVMMATPCDLEDFALGFSLSEGIIQAPSQVYGIEVMPHERGIEVHIELASECFAKLKQRRRNLTGRTGCGLCGAESLGQAIATPQVQSKTFEPTGDAIELALKQLSDHQIIQADTGATHSAALCDIGGQILLCREDVGRHNALDKLIGAWQQNRHEIPTGFVLISSRASYEMVNKCAQVGIANLVAISAPTTLAIEQAKAANMNLIGFARPGRHVLYTRAQNLSEAMTSY